LGQGLARRARPAVRRGFSLVEALVAITIAALAASALSLGLTSSLQTTEIARDELLARGVAEQLMDEIAGARYMTGSDPYQVPLGPSSWEQGGVGRERFNDIDDYQLFVAAPPQGPEAAPLGRDDGSGGERHASFFAEGSFFDGWTQIVLVYYVDQDDPSQPLPLGQTSDFRAVEVRIFDSSGSNARELVRLRRVFSYLP